MFEFDTEFAKAAVKEFGLPIVILAAITILKQVGLLDFESFAAPLSAGTFFGGVILIIVTLLVYFQRIFKTNKFGPSKKTLETIQSATELADETSKKVNELHDLIMSQNVQSNQMHNLLVSMYDLIKGTPNKHLIYEILIVRSKYLLNNSLEHVLEYIVSRANNLDTDGLLRIQTRLDRDLTRLKVEYLESMVQISHNLISNEKTAEITDILDKTISNLYGIITEGHLKIEDILFKVNTELKDLEDILRDRFRAFIGLSLAEKNYIL